MKKEVIYLVIEKLRAGASSSRENAAYLGSCSDGGASASEENIQFYINGLRNEIPSSWQDLYKKCDKQYESDLAKKKDIEYTEYVRLKNKFENSDRPRNPWS